MQRNLLLSAIALMATLLPTAAQAQFPESIEAWRNAAQTVQRSAQQPQRHYQQSPRQVPTADYRHWQSNQQTPVGGVIGYQGRHGHVQVGGFAGQIVNSIPQGNFAQQPRFQPQPRKQPSNAWNNLPSGQPQSNPGRGGWGQTTYRQPPATQTRAQSQPDYEVPIGQVGGSKRHDGVDYDSNAGIGFDQRSDKWVGGRYDSKDGGMIGGGGSVGAGLYGDAGVSQSGKIGKVDIRNHASAEGFVGTEAGAKAGVTKKGVEVGANAFAGGRVSGTVGSDVGPVGYGATGEAWSGVGLEGGVNGGFKDGKLKFGAAAGAALGVGGKLGFQAEIDVKKIGNGVKKAGQSVGKTAKKVGSGVGNAAKKVGSGVGDAAKKVGNGTKKFFNKLKKK